MLQKVYFHCPMRKQVSLIPFQAGIQEIKEIVEAQKELDSYCQESEKQGSKETVTSMSLKSMEHKQQLGKTEELKSTCRLSNRAVKHSALSIESLRKIQADRWAKHKYDDCGGCYEL